MRKFIFILVSVLVVAGFFGLSCGRGDRFMPTMTQSDDSSALSSTADDNDNYTSIYDKDINNIEPIMKSIIDGDVRTLAWLVAYPLSRAYPLKDIENGQQMAAYFDVLFDDSIKDKLRRSTVKDWSEYGWRGYSIFDGTLWVTPELLWAVYHRSKREKALLDSLERKEMSSLHPSLRGNGWQTVGCFGSAEEGMVVRIDSRGEQYKDEQYRMSIYHKGSSFAGKPNVCLTGTIDVLGTIHDVYYTFKGKGVEYVLNDPAMSCLASLTVHKLYNGEENDYQLARCYWLDLIKKDKVVTPSHIPLPAQTIYEGNDKNGKPCRFYMKKNDDILWELWVDDKRIDDVLYEGMGVPEMDAFPSPDGRYVYVVTDIHANGVPLSCFVYQINTQSLRVKLIDNGTGFYKTRDGFSIIVPRCINPDAESNAEMRYMVHDEFYGFDGKKKRIGKEREL